MEAVILIGIQATGKSTFFKECFADTHVRINLDMLKTRRKEEKLVDACISMRQRFVVDNTNPTAWDRARYITKAKEAGFRVIGYYFDSKLEDALTRNSKRGWNKNIPRYAIIGTFERLQKPSLNEGFDEICRVTIADDFKFKISRRKATEGYKNMNGRSSFTIMPRKVNKKRICS